MQRSCEHYTFCFVIFSILSNKELRTQLAWLICSVNTLLPLLLCRQHNRKETAATTAFVKQPHHPDKMSQWCGCGRTFFVFFPHQQEASCILKWPGSKKEAGIFVCRKRWKAQLESQWRKEDFFITKWSFIYLWG